MLKKLDNRHIWNDSELFYRQLENKDNIRIIDNLEGKNRDSEGKYGLIPELDGQI